MLINLQNSYCIKHIDSTDDVEMLTEDVETVWLS